MYCWDRSKVSVDSCHSSPISIGQCSEPQLAKAAAGRIAARMRIKSARQSMELLLGSERKSGHGPKGRTHGSACETCARREEEGRREPGCGWEGRWARGRGAATGPRLFGMPVASPGFPDPALP